MSSTTIPETGPELLNLRQLAALCQVSERTAWQWANDGTAPPPLRISSHGSLFKAGVCQLGFGRLPNIMQQENNAMKNATRNGRARQWPTYKSRPIRCHVGPRPPSVRHSRQRTLQEIVSADHPMTVQQVFYQAVSHEGRYRQDRGGSTKTRWAVNSA